MSLKKAFTKMGLLEEETVPLPATKTQVPTTAATTTSFAAKQTLEVQINPKFSKLFQESLQESKLSGFDYLKFISATDEMKTYGTPEDTRYKMAFFAAKQLGVDKDSLVKSGQHYLDVLAKDAAAFNADCAQYEKKEIQSRTEKVTELTSKIASLNEQLAQAKQDFTTLNNEIQEEKATLESERSSFQVTLESFTNDIEANIAKINKYLS